MATSNTEAEDWTGNFTVEYSGQKNVVCRCPDCGTETGARIIPGTTVGPSGTVHTCCDECGAWKDHYAVREAERGEYDSQFICDCCDLMYTNTMDADMCCNDDAPEDAREAFATDA